MSPIRQFWHTLLRARGRDLVFIFIGLFVLVVLLSLAVNRIESNRQEKEKAAKHAVKEDQRERERQRMLMEQRRLEAERAQAQREEQERKHQEEEERRRRQALAKQQQKAEEEARRKLEEEERHRLKLLSELRQLGVRSIPIHSAQIDPFQNLGVWLKVQSEPEGANVFLDWADKGHAPLWLNGIEVSGLLVVTKKGHQPWFRDINYQEGGEITATLSVAVPPPQTRLLLLVENGSATVFPTLRSKLIDAGFVVLGADAAQAFSSAEHAAGGLSNSGFRAWIQANFNTAFLLKVRAQHHSRDIGAQSQALAGTVRVFVDIDLDVYDLVSGQHLTMLSTTGSAFALGYTRAFNEALEQASAEAAVQLRVWPR